MNGVDLILPTILTGCALIVMASFCGYQAVSEKRLTEKDGITVSAAYFAAALVLVGVGSAMLIGGPLYLTIYY